MNPSNKVDIPEADFFAALDAMSPVAAPVMPEYKVVLNFRTGPAFAMDVRAANESAAVETVRRFARQCDVSGAEKAPTVRAAA